MRVPRRRTVLALLGLLGAALSLLLLGLFPQEPVRRILEARLREAFGPAARVGRIRVFPAGLRAGIEDLVLETPTLRIEVPRARLDLGLATLTGGALTIRSLELDEPRVLVRASAPAPAAASLAIQRPILVRRIAVRGGRLELAHAELGGPVRLHGFDLDGSLGTGSLEVRVAGGEWARPSPLPLGPARARLRVSPLLALEVESFEAATAGSRIRASGSLGRATAIRPDLGFDADLDMAEVSAIAGGAAASGRLGVAGRFTSGQAGPELEAEMVPSAVAARGVTLDGGRLRVVHRGGETTATPSLRLLGGTLSGEARLAGSRTRGELRAAGFDAGRVGAAFAPSAPALAGSVEARLTWSGDLEREVRLQVQLEGTGRTQALPELRLGLDAEGRGLPKQRRVELRWHARASGQGGSQPRGLALEADGTLSAGSALAYEGRATGTATVRVPAGDRELAIQAEASGESSRLVASAEIAGVGGALTARIESEGSRVRQLAVQGEGFDLAAAVPDAAGRLSFHLDAEGPLDRLALRGEGTIDGLVWRQAALGPVGLELRGDARSPELSLRAPDLAATAEARLPRPGAASGRITLDRTPLEPFSSLAGTSLGGTVSGAIRFEGLLAEPARMAAEARLDELEVSARGLSLRAARPIRLAHQESVVRIDDLSLVGEGLRLESSGSLATASGASSSLRVSGAAELERVPAPETWQRAGRVEADLGISGPLRRPSVTGAVTLASVSVSAPGMPAVRVDEGRIRLEGDAVVADGLTAALAGGQATISGRAPLPAFLETLRRDRRSPSPEEQASLRLSWSGIDTAAILEGLRPGSPSILSGALSGEATLQGGLSSVRELVGSVSVPRTALLADDLTVDVGPIEVVLREGVATLAETALATPGGSVTLRGSVDFSARRFDAAGAGSLDLRALTPLLGAARLGGTAELDLQASGAFDSPQARGRMSVAGATLRVRDVPQAVTDIQGRMVFDGRSARVEEASAVLGGGPLTLSGGADLGRDGLTNVDLTLVGKDMALRYPLGLRTRVDAELRLGGRSGALRLAGSVKARSGRYDLERVLRDSLRGKPLVKPVPSPFLRGIALEVTVDVERPIVVRSSLTDVRVGGRLSMLGDLETPEPHGQLELERAGKIYLQGRTLDVQRGYVMYDGTWDPGLDMEMTTRIAESTANVDYDVTVTATGTLASPNLGFDSQPRLSEAEIRSLIATGSLGASTFESSKVLAGDQAAMLLAGGVGRGIADTLHLDEVSIQPQLLSREQDPGAKFVFGKRLTRHVRLAYSLSLNDPEDRFIQLSAEPWRDVTGQVQVREDGTWSVGAGQRLEFGGPKAPRVERRARERRKLEAVRLEGDLGLPEAELRKGIGLGAGSSTSTWDLQERADKLRQRLIDAGFLESEVSSRLDQGSAVFVVQSGPRYRWKVEGMDAPPSLDSIVRSAFFADEALELGRRRLLQDLRARGHLRAEVQASTRDEPDGRVLAFAVKPGRRHDSAVARFPGASALGEARLLQAAGGPEGLLGGERDALQAIRGAYAEIHHLAAEAGPVSVREDADRLLIEVPVREGSRARFSSVTVEDSTLPDAELYAALRLEAGAPYDEDTMAAARQRLRDHYLGLGFPKVRVTPKAAVVGPDVDVSFRVVEGPRLTVGRVEVAGATRTRRSLILGKVKLKPGDPLDIRKVTASERALRDLALFRRVVVDYTDDSPATVTVEVEEQAPLAAGYQLRYNEEDGPSGEVEVLGRNLLGTGLTLGARYRRGADVDEERGSLDLPSFFRGRFTGSVFRLFEELPGGTDTEGNQVTNRRTQRGFQAQQTFALRNRWNLLVAYRFKRVTNESPFLPEPIEDDIAALDLSVLRETRDNPLDSRRGRFWSLSVELSPKALGSDLTFIKGFAQSFISRSFGTSLTWSQGYRLGLATGFNGQNLVRSERFTAGGANSLRGFETDSVGPRDVFGDPTGGQAVVILNQELRLHHKSGLGAAFFYDGGNVFASVRDMSFDLRHVLGGGIRYASPVGLLRLDLGFPLFREADEKSYQLFFSFGQAF